MNTGAGPMLDRMLYDQERTPPMHESEQRFATELRDDLDTSDQSRLLALILLELGAITERLDALELERKP